MENTNTEENDLATASEETAKSIKAIDRTTVHRICSGQVVLTLATAVKELVENSIDAGATSVEVRLKDHAISLLEVCDNGKGVEEDDFEGLTLKHHTSKLRDFGDLVGVKTFGFRGEALSSLCALSNMTIITRHASQTVGTKLAYDHNGKLLSKSPVSRQVGTTVTLQNLFSTLPVRHKEFQRNVKKEFSKMIQVLYSYCLISKGVRINCTNQAENGKKTIVVSTNGHNSIKENISSVYGAKQVSSLLEFKQESASEEVLAEYGISTTDPLHENRFFSFEGHISSCAHGLGRSATDRQFYFINSRPCDPAKVSKVVNEVYHSYNRHQSPFVVLNICLKEDDVDINVTPDKRQILVNNEKILLATLKTSLVRLYENIPSTYNVQNASFNSSLNNSFELSPSIDKMKSPTLHGSASKVSALTLKFGRSVTGSPVSSTPRNSIASPHGMGMKRSYSDSTTSLNNKQRKLDSFFSSTSQSNTSESMPMSLNDTQSSPSMETLVEGIEEFGDDPFTGLTKTNEFSDMQPSQESTSSSDKENDSCVGDVIFSDKEGTATSTQLAVEKEKDVSLCIADDVTSAADNTSQDIFNDYSTSEAQLSAVKTEVFSKFDHSLSSDGNENLTIKTEVSSLCTANANSVPSRLSCPDIRSSPNCKNVHDATNQFLSTLMAKKFGKQKLSNTYSKQNSDEGDIEILDHDNTPVINDEDCTFTNEEKSKVIEQKSKIIMCEEYDTKDLILNRKRQTVSFSMDYIKSKLNLSRRRKEDTLSHKFHAKISPGDNKSAEDELRKEISKDMFSKMEVLGQFNLGFIIIRLGTDLFIIDQHASDEKYNFETLQQTCVLQNQRLIIPQILELTAVNESILLDNIEIFRKNGFEFKIDEEKAVGRRVSLVSIPFSRDWDFGKEDIDELIFMLSDAPGVMCRPSRVRTMFASRACRKSVMIGTALNVPQMEKLVLHMGEIEQPWNCPHGRPTMRHLINMAMISSQNSIAC